MKCTEKGGFSGSSGGKEGGGNRISSKYSVGMECMEGKGLFKKSQGIPEFLIITTPLKDPKSVASLFSREL